MRGFTSLPRPALLALATLFAVAMVVYSATWMVAVRWQLKSELGVNFLAHEPGDKALHISDVLEDSPAALAGVRMNDRIVAINGRRLDNLKPFYEVVMHGQPGDVVTLTIERPGLASPEMVIVTLASPTFRAPPPLTATQRIAYQLIWSYPALFLAVGLPVLFLRLRDRNAWLLALVFAGFIASAPIAEMEGRIFPPLRGFVLAFNVILAGLAGPLFYYFFAVFPVRSPLDRRWPWLKHVLLWGTFVVVAPLGFWVLLEGHSQPLATLTNTLGTGVARAVLTLHGVGAIGLGLVSLVWNNLRAPDAAVARRTRVILWGTVVGLAPMVLLNLMGLLVGKPPYAFLFWIWAPSVLALFLFPLAFAYAVLKYRVLEIPVLLKRSARYFLAQRGFTVLILMASAVVALLVGTFFVRVILPRVEFATPVSIGFGISFGLLLAWAGVRVEKHVTERIDRAFFRRAYDARLILQDLAEKTRTVNSRDELAALLQFHLNHALLPRALVVYLQTDEGRLEAARGRVLAGLEIIPSQLTLLSFLAKHGKPWDVPPPEAEDTPDLSFFAPLRPECLVPILSRKGDLIGLVVLGPRLSEEPYSGEDKRLLASAASQAGIALESIRLAEDIARRLESERRVAHEMDIAKQVQEKLLPQNAPPMATLDYTGACVQARTVGGDYYDFLDLGPGRLGLVLADISGKGISAALLMANLQANLRSQYALALEDIGRLLQSVNRLFHDSTGSRHFATFFFGYYDDAARRLRYVNCGHNPPVVLRAEGGIERLQPTSTVLGVFVPLESEIREVALAPGDTLVIFSDGATEAMSDSGEEFGDQRVVEAVCAHRALPVNELLSKLVETVQVFSGREQEDDLTLLVARAR